MSLNAVSIHCPNVLNALTIYCDRYCHAETKSSASVENALYIPCAINDNPLNKPCPVDVICCDKLVIPEHISFNGNGKLEHGVVVVDVGGKLNNTTIASQYGKLLCCDIHDIAGKLLLSGTYSVFNSK